MNQTRANKFRGLATGFLGWFLVGNLMILAYSGINRYWEALFYGFGLLTLIVIFFLLYKKKTWVGYGIIAAVITNAMVWMILFGGFDWSLILIPLPIGIYVVGL